MDATPARRSSKWHPCTGRQDIAGRYPLVPHAPWISSVHSAQRHVLWSAQVGSEHIDNERITHCVTSSTMISVKLLPCTLSYAPGLSTCANSTYPYGNLKTRSEEHTSELQSIIRKSYAVFCLKKKNT